VSLDESRSVGSNGRLSADTQPDPGTPAGPGSVRRGEAFPMSTPNNSKNTNAFFAQAAISFGVALLTMVFAVLYLPVDPWIRAFLGIGVMYLTTSSFTLAKCVRDAQENQSVYARLDQARVDKILAEHDPFRSVS
jgi:hypothetical protein